MFSYQILDEHGTPTKWYAAGWAATYWQWNPRPSYDASCYVYSGDPLYTDSAGQHFAEDATPDRNAPYQCEPDINPVFSPNMDRTHNVNITLNAQYTVKSR